MKKSTQQTAEATQWVSPVGWYVAWELLRFEWDDEDKTDLSRRCWTWENQILIQAQSPEEAYAKAVAHGQQSDGSQAWEENNEARRGRWRFEGLTSLLAIYDEPADGAEITWDENRRRSVGKTLEKVKSKEQLEVFNK